MSVYPQYTTHSLALQISYVKKLCGGNFALFPCCVFPPENSDIQLAPLLSALVLAWCQYFLLVAIRSLPRLSYLPTLAKLYSQGFNHLLVMMKELN